MKPSSPGRRFNDWYRWDYTLVQCVGTWQQYGVDHFPKKSAYLSRFTNTIIFYIIRTQFYVTRFYSTRTAWGEPTTRFCSIPNVLNIKYINKKKSETNTCARILSLVSCVCDVIKHTLDLRVHVYNGGGGVNGKRAPWAKDIFDSKKTHTKKVIRELYCVPIWRTLRKKNYSNYIIKSTSRL